MSLIATIFLDECLPKKIAQFLKNEGSIFTKKYPCNIEYVPDIYQSGAKDKDWIPEAAKISHSLIITADRGRKKQGDKLPEICMKNKIKNLVLSPSIQKEGLADIAVAIFACWDKIYLAATETPDCIQYQLELVDLRGLAEVGNKRFSVKRIKPKTSDN